MPSVNSRRDFFRSFWPTWMEVLSLLRFSTKASFRGLLRLIQFHLSTNPTVNLHTIFKIIYLLICGYHLIRRSKKSYEQLPIEAPVPCSVNSHTFLGLLPSVNSSPAYCDAGRRRRLLVSCHGLFGRRCDVVFLVWQADFLIGAVTFSACQIDEY